MSTKSIHLASATMRASPARPIVVMAVSLETPSMAERTESYPKVARVPESSPWRAIDIHFSHKRFPIEGLQCAGNLAPRDRNCHCPPPRRVALQPLRPSRMRRQRSDPGFTMTASPERSILAERNIYPTITEQLLATRPNKLPPAIPGALAIPRALAIPASFKVVQKLPKRWATIVEQWLQETSFGPKSTKVGYCGPSVARVWQRFARFGTTLANDPLNMGLGRHSPNLASTRPHLARFDPHRSNDD